MNVIEFDVNTPPPYNVKSPFDGKGQGFSFARNSAVQALEEAAKRRKVYPGPGTYTPKMARSNLNISFPKVTAKIPSRMRGHV